MESTGMGRWRDDQLEIHGNSNAEVLTYSRHAFEYEASHLSPNGTDFVTKSSGGLADLSTVRCEHSRPEE